MTDVDRSEYLPAVNRFEVIDHRPKHPSGVIDQCRGRVLTVYDMDEIMLSYQDNGRTLKVFLK